MGLEKKALGHNLWFYFRCRFPPAWSTLREWCRNHLLFLFDAYSWETLEKQSASRKVGQKLALKAPFSNQRKTWEFTPPTLFTTLFTLPTKCSHLLQGVGANDGMDVSYLLPRFFDPGSCDPLHSNFISSMICCTSSSLHPRETTSELVQLSQNLYTQHHQSLHD